MQLKRRAPLLVAVLLSGAGIVLPLSALLFPPVVKVPTPREPPASSQSPGGGQPLKLPSTAVREEALARNYRLPLFDPPPPAPEPPPTPPAPPPLSVRLVATMLESSGNRAMFADPSGKMFFRREGELLGAEAQSGEILNITSTGVKLKYFDQEVNLNLNSGGP